MRALAIVNGESRQPMLGREVPECFGRGQVIGCDAAQRYIDALIAQRKHRLGAAVEQAAKRRDQSKQFGPQDMALAHVDDAMAGGGIETDRPAAAFSVARRGCVARIDAAGISGRGTSCAARRPPRDRQVGAVASSSTC